MQLTKANIEWLDLLIHLQELEKQPELFSQKLPSIARSLVLVMRRMGVPDVDEPPSSAWIPCATPQPEVADHG